MKRISVLLLLTIATSVNAQSRDTLSLTEAVNLALKESPAIQQGEAAIDVARARTGQVEAVTKPQLSANGIYTRIDPTVKVQLGSQSFQMAPNDNYNANLTLQQSIYDFGRADAQIRVAQSAEKSAADNLNQYRNLTAYQTVQVYYALLSTDESLRIEEDQLRVLRETLGITQERERAGTATTLDPLTTQVRISSIESQIADLRSARLKQESMLRRLTGIAPGTQILVSKANRAGSLPSTLDSLRALADLNRTEIQVAKDAEATAKLQIDAASKGDNPSVAANISAGVKDGYLPDLYKPMVNWAGTLDLKVPILDGGRTKYQVEEAEANYRYAHAHLLDVERSIASEVEQAIADVQASQTRLNLTSMQIRQAQEAYDIALLRYRNGAATNLDLVTAQSALEQANLQRAQLGYANELYQYDLNRAVGTPIW